jgi:predicted ATP-grasp superfamily ATP-dependent carboligase
LNILVYEHACGGGFAEGAVSPGILAEGFGMLRSCVANLKTAGHEVTVIADEGLLRLNPPLQADCGIPIFSFKDAQQAVLKACANIDAAYVIAPETGGTLQAIVEFIEQNGVPLLNCRSNAIRAVSDKASLYETLKANRVKTPRTVRVNVAQYVKDAVMGKFDFPVVFKPVDGVGCSGLSIVKDASQVEEAIEKIDAELASETFMVQEYLEGETVSVSLLYTGTKTLPVSLNKQNVTLAKPSDASCYMGGCVPFDHEMKQKAFNVAEKVVGCFSGLKGYVGVDLILTEKGPVVVDVNPRLTTSFVGLNRIAGFNFAEAIVDAALKNMLPSKAALSGYACFSKIETPKPDLDVLDKLFAMPEVVSPPFPVHDCDTGCALICVEANTPKEVNQLLAEAKKRVLDNM